MKTAKQPPKAAERLARLDAEDRAVAYLETLPPMIALATALVAEASLAERWSAEYQEMGRMGDSREVFPIEANHLEIARTARSLVPPDVKVELTAMHRVLSFLEGFPLDRMWKSANVVAWRTAVRALQVGPLPMSDFLAHLNSPAQRPNTSES